MERVEEVHDDGPDGKGHPRSSQGGHRWCRMFVIPNNGNRNTRDFKDFLEKGSSKNKFRAGLDLSKLC